MYFEKYSVWRIAFLQSPLYIHEQRVTESFFPNHSLTYDPFTQMTMRIDKGTDYTTFEYDGAKERITKTEKVGANITSTLYLHGMNDYPLTEKATNLLVDRQYIYGPTGLIAILDADGIYYILKDHLGSTRVVLQGSSNTAISWYSYWPFGGLMGSPYTLISKDVLYRFTGQEADIQSGLHNFRARLYDSDLGRFYAMDPARQTWSRFGYAGNNPIIYVDKDGRWFIIDDLIVSVFSFAVGYVTHGISTGNWGWEAVKTGGISAVAGWLGYNTGGAAAGLFFKKGTAAYAITSSAIGGAVGGSTGNALSQYRYTGRIDPRMVGRAALEGFGGGLLGGAADRYISPLIGRFPGNNLARHLIRSTAYEIGSNLAGGRSVFQNLSYGINPFAVFPLAGDVMNATSYLFADDVKQTFLRRLGLPEIVKTEGVKGQYIDPVFGFRDDGNFILGSMALVGEGAIEGPLNGIEFDVRIILQNPYLSFGLVNRQFGGYIEHHPPGSYNNYFWNFLHYWR